MRYGLCILALLAACGDSIVPATTFSAAPLLHVESLSGALLIAVHTAPQPPQRGVIAARFDIQDQHGAPVPGLDLKVVPWMPEHGHGASVTPIVTELGDGSYLATDVYLAMPGLWQLRLSTSGGDSAEPSFQIP